MSAKVHGDKFRNILDRILDVYTPSKSIKSSSDYYKLYEYLINNNHTEAKLKALELLKQEVLKQDKTILEKLIRDVKL